MAVDRQLGPGLGRRVLGLALVLALQASASAVLAAGTPGTVAAGAGSGHSGHSSCGPL